MASLETDLTIVNQTPYSMSIKVSNTDKYDWDGNSPQRRNYYPDLFRLYF